MTALDLSNTELKTKTQHIDPLLTNLTQTTFNQKINLTNGISNSIVLDPLNGSTYFSVPIEVNNSINQTSGNLATSTIVSSNNNNNLQIGSSILSGQIDITASTINLHGIVNIYGMINDTSSFFTQW